MMTSQMSILLAMIVAITTTGNVTPLTMGTRMNMNQQWLERMGIKCERVGYNVLCHRVQEKKKGDLKKMLNMLKHLKAEDESNTSTQSEENRFVELLNFAKYEDQDDIYEAMEGYPKLSHFENPLQPRYHGQKKKSGIEDGPDAFAQGVNFESGNNPY